MSASKLFLEIFPSFTLISGEIEVVLYPEGSHIIHEGDTLDSFFFILKGNAWIYQTQANGKNHLFQIYESGEIGGDVEYFLGCGASCSVKVTNPIRAARISFTKMRKLCHKHPEITEELAACLATKLHKASNATARNINFPLKLRLAYFIQSRNIDFIPIVQMEEIANTLGTTRRHLRRVFARFSETGILTRKQSGYAVSDSKRLKEMAEEINIPHS